MFRSVFTLALTIGLAGAVLAQSDAITTRRNIMKGVGGATRTGGLMAKGDQPFDLAKAQDVFKTYISASENFPKYFPDDSKTGGDTTASPKIWENKADFEARFAAWNKDVKVAAADTKDLETFKVAFGNVGKACGSCHNVYRVKT